MRFFRAPAQNWRRLLHRCRQLNFWLADRSETCRLIAVPNAVTTIEIPATFPRSVRLLTPGAFTAVFEKRSVRRGRFFHLHVGSAGNLQPGTQNRAPDNGPVTSRIGIAVPKKLLRTAVHRNTVKRIAREAFRRMRSDIDGRDYVLRLAVKLDPKRVPLDRQGLAADIHSLFAGRQYRTPAIFDSSTKIAASKGA